MWCMHMQVNLEVEEGTLVDAEGNSRSLVGDELRANNGYAHAIDGVLFPPNLHSLTNSSNAAGGSFEGVFDIFLAGVERLGLDDTLSGLNGLFTVCVCHAMVILFLYLLTTCFVFAWLPGFSVFCFVDIFLLFLSLFLVG